MPDASAFYNPKPAAPVDPWIRKRVTTGLPHFGSDITITSATYPRDGTQHWDAVCRKTFMHFYDTANQPICLVDPATGQRSAPDTGDKVHISVHPDDLPIALETVRAICQRETPGLTRWKLTLPETCPSLLKPPRTIPVRLRDNAQITAYLMTNQSAPVFAATMLEIDSTLAEKGVRPTALPTSDLSLGRPFVSYRHKKFDRDAPAPPAMANEPMAKIMVEIATIAPVAPNPQRPLNGRTGLRSANRL